jgi:uncharacterized membrane protein SpoIIM required for sporulation
MWDRLARLLSGLEKPAGNKNLSPTASDNPSTFPGHYKMVCNHYALAQSRHYSPALVMRLHELVLRGHRQLYRPNRAWLRKSITFIGSDFPRTLRSHARVFYLALLIFIVPAAVAGYVTYHDPVKIYGVMDESQVSQIEYMYDPQNRKPGRDMERTSETNVQMFGFYILHNISIGFRTFAGGLLLGLGTLLALLFNGIFLGAISGHLSHAPYSNVFWPFVAGHGAFELTAIVISGAAGLLLARAVIMPGCLARRGALKEIAPEALKLVMGAAFMLVIAAFVEAFWSPSSFSPQVRLTVAALNWSMVIVYFILAGKKHES